MNLNNINYNNSIRIASLDYWIFLDVFDIHESLALVELLIENRQFLDFSELEKRKIICKLLSICGRAKNTAIAEKIFFKILIEAAELKPCVSYYGFMGFSRCLIR